MPLNIYKFHQSSFSLFISIYLPPPGCSDIAVSDLGAHPQLWPPTKEASRGGGVKAGDENCIGKERLLYGKRPLVNDVSDSRSIMENISDRRRF